MKITILHSTLKQLLAHTFSYASRFETVTYMAPAGSGKRTLMKYALQQYSFIKKYFPKKDTTVFVFVDPEDLVGTSSIDYLRLMRMNVHKASGMKKHLNHIDDEYVLESLRDIVSYEIEKGKKIIWIINNLEHVLDMYPLLCDTMLSLKYNNPDHCSFVFLSTTNIINDTLLKKVRNSKFELTKNLEYHPMLSVNEAVRFAYAYARNIKSPYTRPEIEELCV